MTALEAKEKADVAKETLFKEAFEKIVKYFNEQIEKIASEGGYCFCVYPNDEDLIEAIGEREVKEFSYNPDLQTALRKKFEADGFSVTFTRSYTFEGAIRISWKEPLK